MNSIVKTTSIMAFPLGLFCMVVSVSHVLHFRNDMEAFHFGYILVFGILGVIFLYFPFISPTRANSIGRHLSALFYTVIYCYISLITATLVFSRPSDHSHLFFTLCTISWLISILVIYALVLKFIPSSNK